MKILNWSNLLGTVCEHCEGKGTDAEGDRCEECGGYGCFSEDEDRRLDDPHRGNGN